MKLKRMQLLGNSGDYDIVITEIGGTVGDIESLPYIESVRQLVWELEHNSIVIHLTLVPFLAAAGELKDKANSAFSKNIDGKRY
jgi:CTP synthase